MAQQERPNQVVHVRENSEEAMEQLFRVLQTKESKNSGLRARNLPPSFFIPPQRPHPNHSRENSQDSTQFSHGQSQLQPNHSRSHSSPAQFLSSHSLSVPNAHHSKQQSVDILDDSGWGSDQRSQQHLHSFHQQFSQQQQQQQPQQQQQWNVASPNKSTPHLTASPQPGTQLSPNPPQSLPSLSPALPQANPIIEGMLLPLPPGWEISITQDDEIYFINHLNKTTSWFHPSIPKQQQGTGPIRLSQLSPQHRDLVHQRIAQSQQALQHQQLPPMATISPNHGAAGMMAANQQPARIVGTAQQQQQHMASEAYIRAQLQALQMQKQKLQQQQEEIARKEKLLVQRNFGTSSHNAQPMTSSAPNALGIIDENPSTNTNQRNNSQENVLKDLIVPEQMHANPMQVQSSGVDPFLGQGQNADSHARQNSTDSGLGGMGNSYSLPRTPEDLLSNVDEMESSNVEGSRQQSKAQSSDFNMNDMAGMNMDIGAPVVDSMDGQMSTMDGADDLIPSLQPDVLNSELLQDMDPNSMLTWL